MAVHLCCLFLESRRQAKVQPKRDGEMFCRRSSSSLGNGNVAARQGHTAPFSCRPDVCHVVRDVTVGRARARRVAGCRGLPGAVRPSQKGAKNNRRGQTRSIERGERLNERNCPEGR